MYRFALILYLRVRYCLSPRQELALEDQTNEKTTAERSKYKLSLYWISRRRILSQGAMFKLFSKASTKLFLSLHLAQQLTFNISKLKFVEVFIFLILWSYDHLSRFCWRNPNRFLLPLCLVCVIQKARRRVHEDLARSDNTTVKILQEVYGATYSETNEQKPNE